MIMIGFAGLAHAQPVYNYAWGGCFNVGPETGLVVQDRCIGGQFDPYVQYLSIENVELAPGDTIFSHDVIISVGPNIPDFWRFDPDGCETLNLQVIQYNSLGAAGCPGLKPLTSGEVQVTAMIYDPVAQKSVIAASTGYSPGRGHADPATVYLLWRLQYSFAYDFVAADFKCAGKTTGQCFHVTRALIWIGPTLPAAQGVQVLPGQQIFVTWCDPDNETRCPGVTQTRESTWGQVKGLYR
jgi:hypothetical protein